MQKGYVYTTEVEGFFGILRYNGPLMIRVIETTSVREACKILSDQFVGEFIPANQDQIKWAWAKHKREPAVLLTDL